jgi:hypothetical protein
MQDFLYAPIGDKGEELYQDYTPLTRQQLDELLPQFQEILQISDDQPSPAKSKATEITST